MPGQWKWGERRVSQERLESKCMLMSYCAVHCFPTSVKEMQPLHNGCTCLATAGHLWSSYKEKKNVPQDCLSKARMEREFTHLQSCWPRCGPFNSPAFLSCIEQLCPHQVPRCSFTSRGAGRRQSLWASEPHQSLARVDPHCNRWDE